MAQGYVVNPLKRGHDSPSFAPKLLIFRKVVSEIICFTKSCQITLSPESCLENHRGSVTGMSPGRAEASSHLLRPGQLQPPEKEGADCCHTASTDNKFLFSSLQGILTVSFCFLLLSNCGYLNVEFIQLSLCRADQQAVPAVIPSTSLHWESMKEQAQRPRRR